MKNKPLVSIITTAYNSERTIQDTIKSVLRQTYPNIEYIIVDGKSTDHTVQIAKRFQKAFEQKGISYRIVSERDRGIYDAMNKGVGLASGDLIGMINSDDWYEPRAAQVAVETFLKTRYDMMYADLRMIKRDGSVFIKKARYRKHYVTTRDWNHPTTFVTREMYRLYRYACEGNADDLDFMLKFRRDHRKIVVVNRVLANYRLGGASNQKNPRVAFERFLSKYRAYRKNGFSRLYLMECIMMETAKMILA